MLRNVLICGRESPNCPKIPKAPVQPSKGTKYTDEAFKKAIPLYEGMTVRINHEPRNVPLENRPDRVAEGAFGNLWNVRLTPEGLRGDLYYDRGHSFAPRLVEEYNRRPRLKRYGLSHHANGGGPVKDGWLIVESIPYVRSVDIVDGAATTASLYESLQWRPNVANQIPFRELCERLLPRVDKAKRRPLVNLMEMDYMAERDPATVKEEDPPPLGDVMVDEPTADADPDDALWNGFRTAVLAIVDDTSMGLPEKLSKIKEYLSAHDKLANGGSSATPKADAPAASETTESLKGFTPEERAKYTEMLGKEAALAECKKAGYEPNAVELAGLAEMSEARRGAMVLSLVQKQNKPRSFAPTITPPKKPDTEKSWSVSRIKD